MFILCQKARKGKDLRLLVTVVVRTSLAGAEKH